MFDHQIGGEGHKKIAKVLSEIPDPIPKKMVAPLAKYWLTFE